MERRSKTTNPSPTAQGRSSGVLLHVTSLPGPYGIGDIGPEARAFVDALARAKQTWWQILPLGPPGAGYSPYQAFSAFAGNPMLISPDDLLADGLVDRRDVRAARVPPSGRVDFRRVEALKWDLLRRAFERFHAGRGARLRRVYERFVREQAHWLDDFALFMALRAAHEGKHWTDWPRELVTRKAKALREAGKALAEQVELHRFVQFLFFRQLDDLRAHAFERGVRLFGDVPIFVSGDSADVWANPQLFLLDPRTRKPTVIAGVPPDYFSKTGQLWGNPLYDWRAMRREKYRWWVARCRAALRQVDLVRIDHFRGFEAYWEVKAGSPTAQRGRWVKGPGRELFETFRRQLGGLPFVAEDLGVITPEVEALRDAFALPGMRVLQFAFGSGPDSPFLPHNYVADAVAYTGTHDNDTTLGWYRSLDARSRRHVRQYVAGDVDGEPTWALIATAWASVARLAIAPLQDVLSLGNEARMNLPGTGEGNWGWRFAKGDLTRAHLDRLGVLTETYGRGAGER